MKKYLLLASVAGCLLAHNAMADDTATVKAKINILPSCQAINVTDIDYGDVATGQTYSVGLSMDFDGTISTEDEATYPLVATGTPGGFNLMCNTPATITYAALPGGHLTEVSMQMDGEDFPSGTAILGASGARFVIASSISVASLPDEYEDDAVQINFAY